MEATDQKHRFARWRNHPTLRWLDCSAIEIRD